MAGQNDFLIFDENKDNMLTQELYSIDGDRTDGFKKGLARSNVNNKVLHQTSKMCSAIGELIKGYDGTATDGGTLTELVDNVNGLFIFKPYVKSANFKKGVYVVGTVNENIYIAKSLIDNNTGHDLTDKQYWEEVKLGGGSGLEVCDIGMALYVDETKGLRRYLNGQIVDINTNTQAFLNRLKQITTLHPSLLCTEDEWQTAKTMSKLGQCGKFVFNYGSDGITVVSVRLPAVVNINGLVDMNNAGLIKDESLPNIKDVFRYYPMSAGDYNDYTTSTGLIKGAKVPSFAGGVYVREVTRDCGISFDASRVSSTYQDNAPVQQEAIQYPYFIQIATGSETEANIVNTLENVNGFTLLESKYSDKPLYNESWLLSNGQYNPKGTYPTVYEALQVEYNTEIEAGTTVTLPSGVSYTKRGLSVKLSTETYTDYDFVLNTAEETFRLPLKTKLASGKAVVGNGMTLGLTDGTNNAGLINNTSTPYRLLGRTGNYGDNIGENIKAGDILEKSIGITTDPTKSGIELSDSGLYLYYYVGETVQNANLIDAGRIGEQLANCITRNDCKAYITETYQNDTSWYRVWSDGWCEQGGYYKGPFGDTRNFTFLKSFINNNYYLSCSGIYTTNGTTDHKESMNEFVSRTVNGFSKFIWAHSSDFYWKACGYIK